MTAFVIVLAIFLICVWYSKAKQTARVNKYIKNQKSNAKLQYDTGCSVLEDMAKMYRHEAAKLDWEKHFGKGNKVPTFLWHLDSNYKHKTFDSKELMEFFDNEDALKFSSFLANEYSTDTELAWVLATAKACGLTSKHNFLSFVYSNDIWDDIPVSDKEISKDFIENWREKYKVNNSYDETKSLLETSVKIKNAILLGDKENQDKFAYGSYNDYCNTSIFDPICLKYEMPTREEEKILGAAYITTNICQLAARYACETIYKKGFAYADTGIALHVNPSEEDLVKAYQGLSTYEKKKLDAKKCKEINEKYCGKYKNFK